MVSVAAPPSDVSFPDSAGETTTDRELVSRFLAGDEIAFSEIVRRHTGLVFGVCQRILRHTSDAEDAFQATFLVLARKARSLEWQESIAGWLHQTARRTSLKLKSLTVRRQVVEAEARSQPASTEALATSPEHLVAVRELGEILDTELAGLPARFREVIILSQVEGLSRDEVAERLGITVAAVKDRLERGREQLRSRLTRRGVTLTATAIAAWLVPGITQAGLTPLTAATSHAASSFATGSMAAGISPTAASLAQGVLNMMGLEKLKYATAWVITFLTAGGIALGMLKDEPTRFERGLRGQVVAVNPGVPSTITISLEEFGTLLNLDVAGKAKVWKAFEAAELSDVKEGLFVSLRLGDDHRTVTEIHVQGQIREAAIKSVGQNGKLVVVEGGDDEKAGAPMEVELAADAILRIGGLPATRDDLKPGMQVPLEFGRDGKRINAIEAEANDKALIDGELVEIRGDGTLTIGREENDEGQPVSQTLKTTAETIITLDGKPAKLSDLKQRSAIKLRLSEDGMSIRAIKATSPGPDDEQ